MRGLSRTEAVDVIYTVKREGDLTENRRDHLQRAWKKSAPRTRTFFINLWHTELPGRDLPFKIRK